MGTLPTNPGKPPGPPSPDMGPPVLDRNTGPVQGYNKGTAKVTPMPVHGSFRGDKNGSVTAAEHAGVPHPILTSQAKNK